MFSLDEFAQLQFLEGRWKGTSPDGKEFFEEYDHPEPTVFQSRRFPDRDFREHTDGATISFDNGEVVSRWGEYTWKASAIGADSAAFEPVSAPSQFWWRRVDADTLEARQRWSVDGKEQEHTMRLTRADAG